MNAPEDHQEQVLYLKYWHVILMLVVQLLGLGYAFGVLKQGQEDLARRVALIESTKFVSREEFDSFKVDLRDSLARIEAEITQRNLEGK